MFGYLKCPEFLGGFCDYLKSMFLPVHGSFHKIDNLKKDACSSIIFYICENEQF